MLVRIVLLLCSTLYSHYIKHYKQVAQLHLLRPVHHHVNYLFRAFSTLSLSLFTSAAKIVGVAPTPAPAPTITPTRHGRPPRGMEDILSVSDLSFAEHLASPPITGTSSIEVKLDKLTEDFRQMEWIILALCEQTNTNLSHSNLGDLPYPATGTEMSPNFGAMSINRQNSSGSAAPSAHSSMRSAQSRESFYNYCNCCIALFSQFMQGHAASPAHANHPGDVLRRPKGPDIQYKSSFSCVVVGVFVCIYMLSVMKSFTCQCEMLGAYSNIKNRIYHAQGD